MHYIIFVTLITVLAASIPHDYTSKSVGSNTGTPFRLSGEGSVTAVRTWEYLNVVYGIQLCYGDTWTTGAGTAIGHMQQFKLFDGETIVQVSGQFTCYITWLMFVTSSGRSFVAGHPSGKSFNMYPEYKEAELLLITGTAHRALTGFSAQWTDIPMRPQCPHFDLQ
uniref:Jacalin-type lectin domain-containing protein n=1 Tax=Neogobius melanostomus TaxID=47308 RepID=A0A8C6WLN9_9GOBI